MQAAASSIPMNFIFNPFWANPIDKFRRAHSWQINQFSPIASLALRNKLICPAVAVAPSYVMRQGHSSFPVMIQLIICSGVSFTVVDTSSEYTNSVIPFDCTNNSQTLSMFTNTGISRSIVSFTKFILRLS